MNRLALCAALLAAVCLAGCGGLPYPVQEDRSTKEAFTPFYNRHKPEETPSMQQSLDLFWNSWEARLQEAEGKADE